ncbi:exodeoxyribonuclease VII small subunit [Clostridium sp. C105KSO13]|uniref:exodeoxyribonuclease VII small subunit n=1 Tax=Clostridium sp. C105KSO13 TaxID=1776045 RepID=UPI0007406503|nr:exodeoxyribonuclease VII small subunit [Clostridium sp. C105KSO13]CUX43308.1 exodeoxyribonuclease VII small subunit [Clostridium sp. C105KSO13]
MAEQENKTQSEQGTSLEELFENLDRVVSRLEGDEVSLEESFQLYQKGMNLLKQCNTTIDTVEKKVQMLDENGETHEF